MIRDISPRETWQALEQTPEACLVDVRTPEEWQFIGIPDISALGKQVALVSWQVAGGLNDRFMEELKAAGISKTQPIYFICRSGARSLSAATAAAAEGYTTVFNVADGFEGPPDATGHRGSVAGWKASGLPRRQG
jgi:rhodanese-related sulfurtransferase